MKRLGNLSTKIFSLENLYLADRKARKGKSHQYGVAIYDKNWEANLLSVHHRLNTLNYKTSPYTTFEIREPKVRLVYRLPYYPDRITHHAVMNVLEAIFTSVFTADTYSCIKGKGIHGAVKAVKKALRDRAGTQYYLKMDIRKFYPSVDHKILKQLLRRKFKDERLLWLLDEIIDSAPGLPIGNYLSQYLANFYLAGLDHWLKEVKKVRYYFRYADDLVILGPTKAELHALRAAIQEYLESRLKLQVKKNYRVAPVLAQGIDFVGYVFRHTHIRLRPSIKRNFARMIAKRPALQSIASYNGWAAHCNSRHLFKTLLINEKFQRLKHPGDQEHLHRQQDRCRPAPESAHHRPRVQNRKVKVRKRQRAMPSDADNVRRS